MVKLEELKSKDIWDLTLDEIEYIYNNLHMNNYVYAALKMYHESNPPLNKIIKIRKEQIPECLHEYAEKLVNLSPYLGNDDSRITRINYKYYAYNLFRELKNIKINEIPEVMSFFSSLAYIPIISEKNDKFDLWEKKVVRELSKKKLERFNIIISNPGIDNFINIILSEYDKIDYNDLNKYEKIVKLIRLSIQTIIANCENNISNKELEKAWESMEHIMLLLEKNSNIDTNNEIHPAQIRYRNSLYLYGGDFLRRKGNYKKALEWYLKDIELEKNVKKSIFYQTRMRTIERLLCVYLVGEKININYIKNLINEKLYFLFQNISSISNKLIRYIATYPNLDLSDERFLFLNTNENDLLIKIYTGEGCSEVFLLTLLYNNIINRVDYKDIEYNKFLDFRL